MLPLSEVEEMQIENDTHQIFCERLCEILDDQDLSYSDLARLAGLNRSTINHWLNGINPTIITVVKICRALYVSSDYLLGLSDKP